MPSNKGVWSEDEHDRFLEAIQMHPHGPWRSVALHVRTRDVRQVQTHAQKYYEKISRHVRGLRKERRSWIRSEHRIDDSMVNSEQRAAAVASISSRLHESMYQVKEEPMASVFLPYLHGDAAPWTEAPGFSDLSSEIFSALDDAVFDTAEFDASLEILFQCLPSS